MGTVGKLQAVRPTRRDSALQLHYIALHYILTATMLRFWLAELQKESFERSIVSSDCTAVAYSDASGVAGAAFFGESWSAKAEQDSGKWIAAHDMHAQNWNESEKQASSTWREVKTVGKNIFIIHYLLKNISIILL